MQLLLIFFNINATTISVTATNNSINEANSCNNNNVGNKNKNIINMKVIVCFGDTPIVVPCGNGNLLVKDLINEATRRYKKAAGKMVYCKHVTQGISFLKILDSVAIDDIINSIS
uniref:Par3_HAL_N_term domain-containing protein n=1 Tax=Glossina brevipalpis TaxID=37001 RepID=A0A1A9W359_9MUSC